MTFIDVLKSILEVALVSFALWGIFHEDRFIAFEEKIVAKFRRRRLKVVGANTNRILVTK